MKIGRDAKNSISGFAKLAVYGLLGFVAYCTADLIILNYRDLMIPDQAPPKKIASFKSPNYLDRSQFSIIPSRNLFNSKGEMPPAFKPQKTQQQEGPVLSQLPITIIGTLVHSDPTRSIVALEIKSKNITGSFSTGAEIEGMATILKIERNVIFIRNLNNSATEYIEMNKTPTKISFDGQKPTTEKPVAAAGGKDVKALGNNSFAIQRATLNTYLNDLSGILMQARAVPNRDPNTGEINGFRLIDMQPGSIYEQLGFQKMDVIRGVNGDPVDSVQKAMEMFNTLKNGSNVKIQVDRSGKNETFNYDIK